jgi:hypothetical protein
MPTPIIISDSTSRTQDVVNPYGNHYTVQQVWVLATENNMPVEVRDIITP